MNLRATWHEFADPQALARALASAVADDLREAIAARDRAALALSGGTTPRAFLRALAQRDLDWPRVTITLTDERWVGSDDARSNERLLRDTLFAGAAASARFVPLHCDVPAPEDASSIIDADIARIGLPFDVVVLGMGLDGHTASLFPDGDRIGEALDARGTSYASPMRSPTAGEPRMTLTLPALVATRRLALHIEGVGKRNVYESLDATLPLGAVLAAASTPVDIYWSP
jgi:6-phosphogluconolactonase